MKTNNSKSEILNNIVCDSLSYEGYGYVKKNNHIFLVENFLPGEIANIKVIDKSKNISYCKVVDLIKPSEKRVAPKNKEILYSGAAVLSNLSYQDQLEWKNEIIYQFTKWNLPKSTKIFPIVPSPLEWNYRNKITVFFGVVDSEIKIGVLEKKSHSVIEQKTFDLVNKNIEKLLLWIQNNINNYDVENLKSISKLMCRYSEFQNSFQVVFYLKNDVMPDNNFIKKMIANFNNICSIQAIFEKENKLVKIYENDYFKEKLGKYSFYISSDSFFQVNRLQTENLYKYIGQVLELNSKDALLDLFCGIGTISIFLKEFCKEIKGIEIVKNAVKNANKNAKENQISNYLFEDLDADKITKVVVKNYNVVVVDPPRSGLTKNIVDVLLESKHISKIAYVSCNYHTLIRDLKMLEKEFEIVSVQPFDMFPQTPHVESVVLLIKTHK